MLRSIAILFACNVVALAATDKSKVVDGLGEASKVLDEIMAAGDSSIPQDLLAKAKCVVIIPGMKKGGFIVGGQFGRGPMICRKAAGWTAPAMMRIEGGSIGLQVGGSSTDVIMLVMNEEGARKLLEDNVTLGGDASVAAGPVGRSGRAATDAQMEAQILSYSRSKGVFAGVSLEGASLHGAPDDNEGLFGKKITVKEILDGPTPTPAGAEGLANTLNKHSAGGAR